MLLTAGQYGTVNVVGMMIGRTGVDQNHVGLLFQTEDGPRVLHLAWHYLLKNDDPQQADFQNYLWVDLNIEDDENRTALAAFASSVWLTHGNIPYGFSFEGSAFNPDGSFVPPPLGQGLTCATFLLQVLHGAGFALVDLKSWQARDGDEEWRQKIIAWLDRSLDVPPGHTALLRQDTTTIRVRPEDVVGAGIKSPWPLKFEDADSAGQAVLAELCDRVQLS